MIVDPPPPGNCACAVIANRKKVKSISKCFISIVLVLGGAKLIIVTAINFFCMIKEAL